VLQEETPALSGWQDPRLRTSFLDASRLGSSFERAKLLGWMVPDNQPVVKAIVSDEDIKMLRVGMAAVCVLDAHINDPLQGEVQRIEPDPIEIVPDSLLQDPGLVSVRGSDGILRPERPHFEVTVAVPTPAYGILQGSVGTVQFAMPAKTLWRRVAEYLQKHFRLRR
jgi:hypothetical protein